MTELEKQLFTKKLGSNIKEARQEASFTQTQFAKFLDLSRPSIVNIESGKQLPPLTVIFDIAKVLSIDVSELLKNLSNINETSNLEESSKQILESWKKSAPNEHSNETIFTIEEFIKDTNHI